MNSNKKLYKSRKDKKIFGLCGGIGEYVKIDPTLIRLAWAMTIFIYGAGFWFYLIAALIVPERPIGEDESIESEDRDVEKESEDEFSGMDYDPIDEKNDDHVVKKKYNL